MPSPAALEVTDAEWVRMALDVIEGVPSGACLVSDDVRSILPAAFPTGKLGGVFMAAKAAGLIAPTGHATSAAKTRRHGSLRTWVRV